MTERLTQEQQSDLARAWEEKLAKAGMPEEPKPDKGRAALKEQVESETGVTSDDSRVLQELYSYWLTRGEVTFGHHRTIAQEIEERLGLPSGTIDETLIKDAEQEVARAQSEAKKIFVRLTAMNPSFAYSARLLSKIRTELTNVFPHFSETNIEEILARVQ
jgi:hypothetical protein